MRILYYSPHPTLRLDSRAGYGTHMRAMIRAFEERGHEVEPLIMGGGGGSSAPPRTSVSPTKRVVKRFVPGRIWNTLKDLRLARFDRRAADRLQQALRRFRPDFVYERAAYLQTSGVTTCREQHIAHVLEMNSPYVEEQVTLGGASWLRARAVRAERAQLQQTDLVAVVSSALAEHLAAKHGVPREKFVVTPNAIFAEDHAEPLPAPKRPSGIPPDAQVIGFVGSIFRWHGLDALLRAFAGLASRHPDAHILIVGDGEPRRELEQLAADLGVGARVHFQGSVPHEEVFGYLRGMDVAVFPRSNWYGSPVKLFEYAAMARPVVAIRNGPVSEVLTDGIHGVLVEDDVEALGAALQELLADPGRARALGAAFRERVLGNHTWDHNASAVLAALGNRRSV